MSQVADYDIANAAGSVVRAELNLILDAIKTNNAGTQNNLGTTSPYQIFADVTNTKLKIRSGSGNNDAANATFFEIGDLETPNLGLLPASGGIMTGALLGHDGSNAAAPAFSFDTDTNLGLYRNAADVMGFSSGGTEQMIFDANGITLRSQNGVRFGDNDNSHYVEIKAGTVSGNRTITLPNESGTLLTSNSTLPNSNLSNSSITIGSTATNLGASNTTITGLSSLTSTTLQSTTFKTNATNRVAPVIQNSSGTEIAKFCKAFVNFDGQGSGSTRTIRDDFNVSSVDDLAVGFYQVNFANNMADANYSALVTGDVRSPNNRLTGTDCNDYTTSSFRISSADVTSQFGNGRADTKVVTVAVFGTT